MATISTGSTMIKFGSNLRIGYRLKDTSNPFTYLTARPTYDQLPYQFTLTTGTWEVEYTELCPNCTGPVYSAPVTTTVVVP